MVKQNRGISMSNTWEESKAEIFWGEIAACDHVVQIYEDDSTFLDVLAGFVGAGINSDDAVIVIATKQHLESLETRLRGHGIHVDTLTANGRYFPLDAEHTLSLFMSNGWPDEELFIKFISALLAKVKKNNRRIRAFGEMVAILWAQGHAGATVQLEHLWNKICLLEPLSLFCAYPKSGFTEDMNKSLQDICSTHSRQIRPSGKSMATISYNNLERKAG